MLEFLIVTFSIGYLAYVAYVKLKRPDIAQRWAEEKRERQRRSRAVGMGLIKWGAKKWL